MSTPQPPVLEATTSEPSSPLDTLKVVSVLQLLILIGMAVLIAATFNLIRVGIQRSRTVVPTVQHVPLEQPLPSVEDTTLLNGQHTTVEPTVVTTEINRPRASIDPEFFQLG